MMFFRLFSVICFLFVQFIIFCFFIFLFSIIVQGFMPFLSILCSICSLFCSQFKSFLLRLFSLLFSVQVYCPESVQVYCSNLILFIFCFSVQAIYLVFVHSTVHSEHALSPQIIHLFCSSVCSRPVAFCMHVRRTRWCELMGRRKDSVACRTGSVEVAWLSASVCAALLVWVGGCLLVCFVSVLFGFPSSVP